jgi:hypothetical protein
MARELMSWEELLSFEIFDEYDDEFGPHTQAVVNCLETLDTISWFSTVGAPTPDLEIARVSTWNDAVDPLMGGQGGKYNEHGHLAEPASMIDEAREIEDHQDWYEDAIEEAQQYLNFDKYIPGYFDKNQVAFMIEHLHRYVENVLIEIIAADSVDTTYFRECLPWYETGHFACGWEGEWPDGVIKVF